MREIELDLATLLLRDLKQDRRHVLTKEEEQALFGLVAKGCLAQEQLTTHPQMASSKKNAYEADLLEAEKARQIISEANYGLLVKAVLPYLHRGLASPDLFSEAWLIEQEAIKGFNLDFGYKFSSYLTAALKNGLQRVVWQDHTIRQPKHTQSEAKKIAEFLENIGQTPSFEEISQMTGIPQERVADILLTKTVLSLENSTIVGFGDEPASLLDIIVDDHPNPESIVLSCVEIEAIRQALNSLTKREKEMIELRYGEKGMSLEEIGQKYGLTRQRVHQIIAAAQNKMRNSPFVKNSR